MDPLLLSFHAPIHDLEVVGRHVVKEGVAERLCAWQKATGAEELVYLATCQRVLWLLWGGDPATLDLGPEVRRYEGEDAWIHMLALSAGLESANLGDREIPDQLRLALLDARAAGVAALEAQAFLDDVIREGQRLRARLGLADGQASVATVALRHLEQALEAGARVALVGLGPMTTYLADRLPERGFEVCIANRTLTKAEAFVEGRDDLKVLPLDQLRKDPTGFDAIVSATASPDPLFTLEAWKELSKHRPLRFLDLALPADSEPALEQLPWVHRVDLHVFLAETAGARAQRKQAAQKAAPWLLQGATRLRERARQRAEKRALEGVRDRLNEAWNALEDEVGDGSLAHLSPEQREAVTELLRRGRTLAHRVLVQGQRPDERLDAITQILQLGAS